MASGTGVGNVLSSSPGSDNILASGLQLTSSLEGRLCSEERGTLGYFNWFLAPPSGRSWRGFFSDIFCKNLIELLEVNLTELLGAGASL